MNKIMFNEQYGLESATIVGKKTMTRRLAYNKELERELHTGWDDSGHLIMCDGWMQVARSKYAVGEELAVAQSYKTIYDKIEEKGGNSKANEWWCELYDSLAISPAVTPGYNNKMFVIANAMPHRIRITDIKLERLQDISDEDCAKEGIIHVNWRQYLKQDMDDFSPQPYKDHDLWTLPIFEESFRDAWAEQKPGEYAAESAKVAFAVLIFKLMGKKVWEQNPWVFAYSYKLVK